MEADIFDLGLICSVFAIFPGLESSIKSAIHCLGGISKANRDVDSALPVQILAESSL